MYRNGVLSGVCLLCYGSTTSALWKLSWAKVCLRPTEFRFPLPQPLCSAVWGGLTLYRDGICKANQKCSLAELLPMQLLPYEILEIDDGIRPYCFLVERLGRVRCIRFKSDIARENKFDESDNKSIWFYRALTGVSFVVDCIDSKVLAIKCPV